MIQGRSRILLLAATIAAAVAVTVTSAEAGSTGNGTVEAAKAHYSYCFGGNQGTVYFSSVIASAPAVGNPELQSPFDKYLHQTYGPVSSTGSTCIASGVVADIVNAKKQREAEFVYRKWKIVETKWAGAGSP
jgi:opacity protein-like surface antigen